MIPGGNYVEKNMHSIDIKSFVHSTTVTQDNTYKKQTGGLHLNTSKHNNIDPEFVSQLFKMVLKE